jgi:hypothetical protein
MDAMKRWTIPIGFILLWLVTAGYTLAALSHASAAWQARTSAVHDRAECSTSPAAFL